MEVCFSRSLENAPTTAVRGQDDTTEGALGDACDGALGEPCGGDGSGAHDRHGADQVAEDGRAELGDDQALLQAVDVARGGLLLGIAAVGGGGVVLAGAGAEDGGRDDDTLAVETDALVLFGAHVGDILLDAGEFPALGILGEFADELGEGEPAAGLLLEVGELAVCQALLRGFDGARLGELPGELGGLLNGGVIGSLVGLAVHSLDLLDQGGQFIADFSDSTHSWLG